MSLATLAAAGGVTLDALAVTCRVKVQLFEQVDLGRQALPLEIADRIGVVLGLQQADVVHEVSRATTSRGENAERPMPPELGDAFSSAMLTPTLPVVPP